MCPMEIPSQDLCVDTLDTLSTFFGKARESERSGEGKARLEERHHNKQGNASDASLGGVVGPCEDVVIDLPVGISLALAGGQA